MTPPTTRCCTPVPSNLFPEDLHVSGCLRGWAGLHYEHGALGNEAPFPVRAPVLPVEEREAAMQRHPTRPRRVRRLCAGYTHTCPWGGCRLCLF